jgi:hypothetical protein
MDSGRRTAVDGRRSAVDGRRSAREGEKRKGEKRERGLVFKSQKGNFDEIQFKFKAAFVELLILRLCVGIT